MTDQALAALAARLRARDLLQGDVPAGLAATIGAVRYDSRMVAPGDLFVACRGRHSDGHDHVGAAVAAGAAAVVVERPVGAAVPELLVSDGRAALAEAAGWSAGDPSARLGVVGITGTDGKTTTAYLVRAILEAAGHPAGLIGTTDVILGGRSLGNDARTSTPEAPELQGYLAAMEVAGDRFAVIETSSHGLAQQRVGAVAYDVAVLTNITSEHLEFHGTLEAYREAKHSLFDRLAAGPGNPDKGWGKHAVVNADDPQGEVAAARAASAGASVHRFGLSGGLRPGPTADLDVTATSLNETPAGMQVRLRAGAWRGATELRLAGRFNVANALAALGVAGALGLDLEVAARALGDVPAVPGRMQRIDEGQSFTVIVDYAHTADSLAKVLDELQPTERGAGRIVVFGSAGDRDPTKRAPMGRVAAERCRLVVVTDEDPRSEDPATILDEIAAGAETAGARRGEALLVIGDRTAAIEAAIAAARAGDVVLLAGKGHEKTIETAAGDVPWDEAAVARQALRRRTG